MTTQPRHLKFFSAAGTCALATHITLEEAGADYELVRLDFSRAEQTQPVYLAVNPKGRVPALLTPQGVLTETPALLAYVAQTHAAATLLPPADDAFALARVHSFNSYLCATVHVAHAHRRRGARWADDPMAHASMQRKVAANMSACFQLIEDDLLAGPWVMGEHYTVCDAYLYTLSGWLAGDGVDIGRFPKAQAHAARMAGRPAVQRAEAAWR
ncbi:MAG: glutathione S-transferase [Pseudomonadota bacterium]|jgi:glutathione S-transferase